MKLIEGKLYKTCYPRMFKTKINPELVGTKYEMIDINTVLLLLSITELHWDPDDTIYTLVLLAGKNLIYGDIAKSDISLLFKELE